MDKVSFTAAEIVTYLKKNPDAEDTVEGIAEWWMTSIIRPALADLCRKGLVVERKAKDSSVYYKLSVKE